MTLSSCYYKCMTISFRLLCLYSVTTKIYLSQGIPWPTLDKVVLFLKELIPEEGSVPLWCYYSTGFVINPLRWSCPTSNTSYPHHRRNYIHVHDCWIYFIVIFKIIWASEYVNRGYKWKSVIAISILLHSLVFPLSGFAPD